MKSKKSSGAFREDNDSFKGKKKHKLTPVKKLKSKKTQFFDEIEEFEENDFEYREKNFDDLYEDIDDLDDPEDDDY